MIKTKNLSVSYQGQENSLNNVNISIEGPGIIGIIGPNGAGKSTFIKSLLNLVDYSGTVTIGERDGKNLGSTVAYVEQRSMIDFHFPITVKECVALGTYARLGLFHRVTAKESEKVLHYLDQVGLKDYADAPINALSGGQFQRMLLARCLIQETQYIFLDEPFVGIDSVSESIILDLLKELRSLGKMILVVHHDLSKVDYYFDRVILLNKEIKAYGPVKVVFTVESLADTYGNDLIVKGEKSC
ncbi:metal ABC transporter ATP-binding protein [Streptococcus iniae]|uniref:metal ABC transporter ATP-binding protein n=1 Tax=Streptococcus iniae TaxID=1346 RepID=UPI0008D92E85|nr:metal ABC transporter ATP-binding protein [Streptococcus iniae]OHX26573.1 manganese ABC transporter ATP-binding protein [Streptococcus iniae]RLV27453.1 metal ABC transporter ATP-binding protein [Streptococcus iniae]